MAGAEVLHQGMGWERHARAISGRRIGECQTKGPGQRDRGEVEEQDGLIQVERSPKVNGASASRAIQLAFGSRSFQFGQHRPPSGPRW